MKGGFKLLFEINNESSDIVISNSSNKKTFWVTIKRMEMNSPRNKRFAEMRKKV